MDGLSSSSLMGDQHLIDQLNRYECDTPHAILGPHKVEQGGKSGVVIRAYHPTAQSAELVRAASGSGAPVQMDRLGDTAIFAAFVEGADLSLRYELRFVCDGAVEQGADPYRFSSMVGDLDLHLHGEGHHYRLYERLGAHPRAIDEVQGTSFALWAPNARRVSVRGSFNGWDGRRHPMRRMGSSGIWEIFIPGVKRGDLYTYEILTQQGVLREKTDPLALQMQLRPEHASVVCGLGTYAWRDEEWMERRAAVDHRRQPMAVYEVHLGSWMRDESRENGWLPYREVAPILVDYVKKHGFTHIELLPIAEHAFDPSWGYQTTGYYAPTSRFGTPDDLRYFIDHCHQNGIGVLIDWVPAHFPKDDYALRWFDGTPLYEYGDPRLGEHKDWGTLIFDYGRNEVRSFLLSNACYWLDQFHVDGLRVDAVASMIYLDYSRKHGEWVANKYGGRENLEAISFLKELNTQTYGQFPGVFTVAEESTSWGGVTLPTHLGGLGFGFKWNMGWMNDTLLYFSKDPIHRRYHHNELTFNMLYTYTENFILPLSHDEVVHMKRSLIGKMPGDDWQRAANLRALLAYQYSMVGKKLLFMGGEIGQWQEWNYAASVDWEAAEHWPHSGIQHLVQDLGQLYLGEDAFWAWDCEPRGFRWIDCHDAQNSVISFMRSGPSGHVVCVFNLTPVPRHDYRIGAPEGGMYSEALNTDAEIYGGSNVGNAGQLMAEPVSAHGFAHSFSLILPPLGALILRPQKGASDTEEEEPGDVHK